MRSLKPCTIGCSQPLSLETVLQADLEWAWHTPLQSRDILVETGTGAGFSAWGLLTETGNAVDRLVRP